MRKISIRPYLSILRKNLSGSLQYRGGTWGRLFTNAFWGCARSAIVVAFYKYGNADPSISMQQAVTLIWLQQIAMNLLPGMGMDFSVWNKIARGDVGYELLRPMDVYTHWYANAVAIKLSQFLLAVVPMSIAGLLVPGDIGMGLPVSVWHLLACLLTLATGLMISCAAICMSYAMLMDVNVGREPASLFMTVTQILAGSYLPLQLWPDAVQKILRFQPFAGMMDIPLRFYVGSEPLSSLPGVVLMQAAWAAVIIFLGRSWIMKNLHKLTIQGG